MQTGAITPYLDVAQIVLYVFWIFFAGLIVYLLREGKREGYPLETDNPALSPRANIQGFPAVPEPKTYLLRDGRVVKAPRPEPPDGPLRARPIGSGPGSPLQPVGDPMLAEVGPGAYTQRPDILDRTALGLPRIVPLRTHATASVSDHDPDPRGLPVIGADGQVGGTVRDLWIDQAEMLFRYLEVEPAGGGTPVLLPINFARVDARRVRVASLLGAQFAGVPRLRDPETITMLEEERVMAYYAAGTLYATPQRQEPLL